MSVLQLKWITIMCRPLQTLKVEMAYDAIIKLLGLFKRNQRITSGQFVWFFVMQQNVMHLKLCQCQGTEHVHVQLQPWLRGRCLAWDSACPNTFAMDTLSSFSLEIEFLTHRDPCLVFTCLSAEKLSSQVMTLCRLVDTLQLSNCISILFSIAYAK